MSAYVLSDRYRGAATMRRRLTALTLALLAVILLILMLLQLGRTPPRIFEPADRPATFTLAPAEQEAAHKPAQPSQPKHAAKPPAAAPSPGKPIVTPPPPPVPMPVPSKPLAMNHDEFAATDIGSLGHHDDAEQGDAAGSSTSVYGPTEGPVGKRLFNAEWYHEPSRMALASYLPPGGAPPGWGMIACRTIERYHVDDCRELGESPAGSGLSRALRQAAWQFLVRPPRVGGKALVGAWVRIRFDFSVKKGDADEPEAR